MSSVIYTMASDNEWRGKVALITGASTGIGEETAYELARHGVRLALVARRPEMLEKVAHTCRSKGWLGEDDILCIPADVGVEEDVAGMVQEAVAKFGNLHIVVANAATSEGGRSILSTSLDTWDEVMRINARSVLALLKVVIPELIKTKGCVVATSSILSTRPYKGFVCYNASKAALDQMMRTAAMEFAPHGVRFNCVNPSTVDTPFFQTAIGLSSDRTEAYLRAQPQHHPLGRIARPEDVAKTIVFLCSSGAAFITGHCVPIDGGRLIELPNTTV